MSFFRFDCCLIIIVSIRYLRLLLSPFSFRYVARLILARTCWLAMALTRPMLVLPVVIVVVVVVVVIVVLCRTTVILFSHARFARALLRQRWIRRRDRTNAQLVTAICVPLFSGIFQYLDNDDTITITTRTTNDYDDDHYLRLSTIVDGYRTSVKRHRTKTGRFIVDAPRSEAFGVRKR